MIKAKGDVVALDGRPYQNDYCFHYRTSVGKTFEIKEYMNPALCEDSLGPCTAELKARLQAA